MRAVPFLQLRWLGVAGLELRLGDQVLLVDPFLTHVPIWRLLWGRLRSQGATLAEVLPRADHILVTHAHFDHVLDVPAIARASRARVYGSANTGALNRACGVSAAQIRAIAPGEALDCEPFSVKVLPAEHFSFPFFGPGPFVAKHPPPYRAQDYRMDSCLGFWVQAAGVSMLCCASQRLLETRPADLLVVGPYFGKTAQARDYYRQLIEAVQPRIVIPYHWDDMWRPLGQRMRPLRAPTGKLFPPLAPFDLTVFESARADAAISHDCQVLIPEPLRVYDLAQLLL